MKYKMQMEKSSFQYLKKVKIMARIILIGVSVLLATVLLLAMILKNSDAYSALFFVATFVVSSVSNLMIRKAAKKQSEYYVAIVYNAFGLSMIALLLHSLTGMKYTATFILLALLASDLLATVMQEKVFPKLPEE